MSSSLKGTARAGKGCPSTAFLPGMPSCTVPASTGQLHFTQGGCRRDAREGWSSFEECGYLRLSYAVYASRRRSAREKFTSLSRACILHAVEAWSCDVLQPEAFLVVGVCPAPGALGARRRRRCAPSRSRSSAALGCC